MSVIYFISLWFEQGVVILSLILLVIATLFLIKFLIKIYLKTCFYLCNKTFIFSSILFILLNLVVFIYDKNVLIKKEIQFKNVFLQSMQ